ncbi:MAG: hypothetical protein HXY24_14225 [Rubrivivax sp.]|nr:hypothetical protein [Rubrivivax sp.]
MDVSIGKEARVLQTDDLFLGALGLVRGGELVRAFVRGTNGRRVAVFEIVGPGMDDVEREYYAGRSLVDLRLLKSEVVRLKNVAFSALRRENEEERKDASQSTRNRRDQAPERSVRGRHRAWD